MIVYPVYTTFEIWTHFTVVIHFGPLQFDMENLTVP